MSTLNKERKPVRLSDFMDPESIRVDLHKIIHYSVVYSIVKEEKDELEGLLLFIPLPEDMARREQERATAPPMNICA
jgi:hypothetical protein